MDLDALSVEDLNNGFIWDRERKVWMCLNCEAVFEDGEIFSLGDRLLEARRAVKWHVEQEHDQTEILLASKYVNLTENQVELFKRFQSEKSDKDIAREMGVSQSTIRHQKFTFREKAKQAKVFLALYERMNETKIKNEDELVKIHEGAMQVDNRYHITEKEREETLKTTLESRDPLVLKVFPRKEKRKVLLLMEIVKQFENGKRYTEKEVNEILKINYPDFVTLRRYLIEYGFFLRTDDGKEYWLK